MNISIKAVTLVAGPLLAVLIYFYAVNSGSAEPDHALAITAAVATLCVVWWIFEPIPIPVTSLLPLAVFQMSGVLTEKEVGESYGNSLILLLLGGLILSRVMERSGAHLRLALFMVNLFGKNSSKRLVLGFMVTSATLSMWISNTATTLILLPVALAVTGQAKDPELAAPLMMSIAFAASIGGIGTPIGTPPNLVLMQVYEQQFNNTISFTEWMSWGVPVVLIMIPMTWLWLTRKLTYSGGFEMPPVGRWSAIEKRVMMVFALTAAAWIFRKEPWGGWSEWLDLPAANDGSVALAAVIASFIIPAGKTGEMHKADKLIDWETAAAIPWGILLLFGGGLALAKAFSVSGLSNALAGNLSGLSALPVGLMVFAVCLGVTFLTETTSNTATTVLLMPLLAAIAMGSNIDPKLLMVPAAISASCAFMMPVATAPNSIVYASGFFSAKTMAREGFVLNIFGAVLIAGLCYAILT